MSTVGVGSNWEDTAAWLNETQGPEVFAAVNAQFAERLSGLSAGCSD